MALQKIPGRAIQLDSQENSDIMFFNGTDWDRLEKGEAEEVLTVNAAGTLPQWNPGWKFGGGSGGYASGGYPERPNEGVFQSLIQKFSFSSNADAVTVANLLTTKETYGGSSSSTHGYSYGGYQGSGPTYSGTAIDVIEKFEFVTDSNGTDVGNLLTVLKNNSGHSSQFYGWLSGGSNDVPTFTDTIQKFTFSTDADSTDVGNLLTVLNLPSGCSDTDYGYTCGGQTGSPAADINVIQRFSFVSDGNSSDVGNLTEIMHGCSGQSSETHGYRSGGAPNASNVIDKFAFGSSSNSTDVGDMSFPNGRSVGISSLTDGYICGGDNGQISNQAYVQTGRTDCIDSFSFATDVIVLRERAMNTHRWGLSGQQV